MFHVKHEMDQIVSDFALPPETLARLKIFENLLAAWNRRIALLGRGEGNRIWERHIADALQLVPLLPPGADGIDLGSGAGFPGLVLAIAAGVPFTLIEANQRKAAFLAEAARATDTAVQVLSNRIETVRLPPARLVTARALAPLPRLLALAAPFLAPDGVALFPKGKNVEAELTDAARQWQMRVERLPSRTDPQGSILRISEIRRVRVSP